MKVQQNVINSNAHAYLGERNTEHSPNFRGGFLYGASAILQGIQNTGFMANFLIQDLVGMTGPRVITAFYRDKEVTGEFNALEGGEVLLREGLTGPLMMSIAPIVFFLSAKFGRTTGVNTRLIKRFGNSLKEFLSNPKLDKKLLENKEQFKKEFFDKNVREMLSNTLGKENVTEESVKYIMSELEKVPEKTGLFNRTAKKAKKTALYNIEQHINNIKSSTSSDLEMLGKVKVGSGDSVKAFSTNEALEAMLKYSDDAITLNKKLKDLDAVTAEKLKDRSIAKRLAANIVTIATTLSVLSVIPKIYARSEISPGTQTANKLKEAKLNDFEPNEQDENNNSEVSFKGKAPKKTLFEKLGAWLGNVKNENFASEFEYAGINFTPTLMAVLSVFGLLFPRGLRAMNRAEVDENGKKDKTELYEILIRDVTSSLSVIFAVPLLTRAFVSSYENKRGFVLMNRNRDTKGFKKFIDLINLYSSMHVLTSAEITNLYHSVDSKDKILNFCKYIDSNNGDLQKILSKSDCCDEIFKDADFKLDDLKKLERKEKNKKITEFFENLGGSKEARSAKIDSSIKKLMQGAKGDIKHNKILNAAKGLNSIPELISLLVISPFILGVLIPKLTYANTRRIHDKKELEKQNKINASV